MLRLSTMIDGEAGIFLLRRLEYLYGCVLTVVTAKNATIKTIMYLNNVKRELRVNVNPQSGG